MRYEFVNAMGDRRVVYSPMADIPVKTLWLAKTGWKRVFSPPSIIRVPGFREAYEESLAVVDDPYLGQGKPKHDPFDEVEPVTYKHAEDVMNE
jgi:hypothetical protein